MLMTLCSEKTSSGAGLGWGSLCVVRRETLTPVLSLQLDAFFVLRFFLQTNRLGLFSIRQG